MSNSWIEVEYIGGYIAVRSKWNDALTMLTLAEASELARDLSAVVAANSKEYQEETL